MAKEKASFEDFIATVAPENRDFVEALHATLEDAGYKLKLEQNKSGFVASYVDGKHKLTVLNYVFRKNRLLARIYADNVCQQSEWLEQLPPSMIQSLQKAPVCRRMRNPAECNPKCKLGFDYTLRGERLQTCRYSGFFFELNEETAPYIRDMVGREMQQRAV